MSRLTTKLRTLINPHALLLALIAFLAAWQGTAFALDARSLGGAAVAALMGYTTPRLLGASSDE